MKNSSKPFALITGSSAGLGAAFARQLAASGHDLLLVARRFEKLTSLAGELRAKHGVAVEVLPADLASETGIRQVEKRIQSLERLDILINCAGNGLGGLFARQPLDQQLDLLQLHCAAPVRLVHAALPGMISLRHGTIINVSSVSAFAPMAGNVMYSATKAFLVSFSRALMLENGSYGIKIQALCPGFFHSEFHDVMRANKSVIPSFLFLTADEVARRSLSALKRKAVVYVPGFIYKLAVFVASLPGLGAWLISVFTRLADRRRAKFFKAQGS